MGKWERTVRQDLQDMLDLGIIPGYIDMSSRQLILTEEGISEQEAQKEPELTVEDDYDILREIRAVNDAIPDEVMSRKIDRIGEITGKILDYQRSRPNRSSQLRSFLNYYLPTTLKVLRAYAQLDSQGVEGENISAAKKRIENMMDQVVYGFEKQLDLLFRDDAMDITSDVEVLENMLRQDGLSGDRIFGSTEPFIPNTTHTDPTEGTRQAMENLIRDLNDDDDRGITLQI
jgi:5-bromo-4-chloroindolyl phosphate hydrolysis protein